ALSVVWTFLLAAALTTGAIAVRGRGGAGAQAVADSSDPAGQSGAQAAKQAGARSNDNAGFGGDFPGVILLPPLQPHTTLVAPLPSPSRQLGASLLAPEASRFQVNTGCSGGLQRGLHAELLSAGAARPSCRFILRTAGRWRWKHIKNWIRLWT
ncbi:MAG TPA: hypothetical protein VN924_24045, partial [Bryobacteraceae bacterium]|nr:hypothetical protein [Bryobacteraceae bacterium]